MTTPNWYQIATGELGQVEVGGQANNPRIVNYQKSTGLSASDDETPWCGAFVAWCFKQAGIKYNRATASRARSWLDWGKELKEPVVGCVVVLRRGSSTTLGHVTFFAGWTDSTKTMFRALGGNQGNSVKVSTFSRVNVLGYRWPSEVPLPNAVAPLHTSGVIQGAVSAGGAAVVGVATNSGDLVNAFHQAHDQLSLGGWIGIACFILVMLGAGYAVYSRVKGKTVEQDISQPAN